jgi:hypothetical protein
MPNSVNGHPNPNGTSTTPTAVAATQVEVSPLQKPLNDRLEVTVFFLMITSMLIDLNPQSLVKEDLKKWIDEHNVAVKSTNKLRSKDGASKWYLPHTFGNPSILNSRSHFRHSRRSRMPETFANRDR